MVYLPKCLVLNGKRYYWKAEEDKLIFKYSLTLIYRGKAIGYLKDEFYLEIYNFIPVTSNRKDLINVDYKLIRELKNNGNTTEANELLKAYYLSKEENTKQLKRELKNQKQKKYLFVTKISRGICLNCDNEARKGSRKCQSCADRSYKHNRNYLKRKKKCSKTLNI